MITCQPDRISELSSEELHKLAVKACAEMRANGELDKAINEASEYLAKLRYDRRVTSVMWDTPFI